MENTLIDLIAFERGEYIKSKGVEPDTMLLNDFAKEYSGKKILGMIIKTSPFIGINQIIIYNSTLMFCFNATEV